jgi:hypothetical protein
MPRTAAKVTQADIARAVKGAQAAGMAVTTITVDHREGRITLTAGTAQDQTNPLEKWRRENGHG